MYGWSKASSRICCKLYAIMNIPCIVQDFYTAGLPVWFLWPSIVWDSTVRCNILETVTGDCNKFSPLDSPYTPYLLSAWSAALQAVDQSPSHLVDAFKTMQNYGHYVFPDPGLFIYPATAERYIKSWLQMSNAWFMCMAKEPFLALSNQYWHMFLSNDNTVLGKGGTKAAHYCQQVLDILLPNHDVHPGVEK